jgi:hypothetical protein
MKRIFVILLIALSTGLNGCANFQPRNNSPINNSNGKIDEIRNNQNGVMAEIGKLKQSAEIQSSQLKEVQNGLLNLNASLSRNENNGVQILQGDGALILVFSLAVIGMLLYWYRDRAIKNEKSVEIMAKEIAYFNDPVLNDNVLRAAMHTESESHVYKMLTKKRKDF